MDKAPDAFRTISEVADELDVPQHVLRFWETRFTQIKPMKRSGGRRFYRPDDVDLLRGIRRLLYAEGYTIRGVQRILKEQGVKAVQAIEAAGRVSSPVAEQVPEPVQAAPSARKVKARAAIVEAEPEIEDLEESDDTSDPTSIVVTPPLPKPFTTPLPSLELRRSIGQSTGMVPRSAMPPEIDRPPKLQPVQPPPTYLPDITFDTSMPVPRRVQQQVPVVEVAHPVVQPKPAPERVPLDGKRLRPLLEELMAVRRLLDAAMLNGDP